jgi:hypothetical protein
MSPPLENPGGQMFFRSAFSGYACKFSPFEDGKLAIATCQNFGIIGNGRQYVVQAGILHAPCGQSCKPISG